MAHRLPGGNAAAAKAEWCDIVEGEHPLWKGVSEPYKDTIRAFLVYFHTQIQRHSTERFNFRNGSVGAALLLFICLVGPDDKVFPLSFTYHVPFVYWLSLRCRFRRMSNKALDIRNHPCTKTPPSASHLALIRQDLRPMLHPREQQAADWSCKACQLQSVKTCRDVKAYYRLPRLSKRGRPRKKAM